MIRMLLQRSFLSGCLALLSFVFSSSTSLAETWQGFSKIDFVVDQHKAFLIEPAVAAPGRPWIWRTEFFGHQPQADIVLLKKGFHVAYVDLQNLYGSPTAMAIMDSTFEKLTADHRLSQKTVLEGFSRGGLFALNWAARNPDKVACIYNDAPVCDFTSWPGGKGKGKGSPGDWGRLLKLYQLTELEAATSKLNPINNLEALASAKIPLLHVCGATDDVVPIDENSLLVQKRYQELGGSMTLISKPNCNHHPHSLEDPTRIVNFVLAHTGFPDQVTEPRTPFGYDYFQLRDGLRQCRDKFLNDKRGRVAFLGGSITASKGWRDLVCEDLKRRFPDTEFDFIAAGIPSLGSTPGAFRFERDVLAKGTVDLLFEEAAVNDDTNGFADIEQVRGMEGIVRQALLSNPKMDVVLLHFVDPGKIAEIRQGKTPVVIANHERVAEHYRIPSVNLAKEVTERIEAGEFTWEKDFRDLHPAPFGHDLYAKSISRLLSAAWVDADTNSNAMARKLPEPLDKSSYFLGRLVGPSVANDNKMLTLDQGWSIDQRWKPDDKAGTRPGFVDVPALVANAPGSTMKFAFKGIGIGIFIAAGPDTGSIEYRVDQGAWQKQSLYTQWSSGLHLPWTKMLASELSDGNHELEIKISEEADAKSQGHAVRIIHFLVNGPK